MASMRCQFTLYIILINFQVVRALTQFMKKYSSSLFLGNQGRSIFLKEPVCKGRCGILFCYFVCFRTRQVRVAQQDFL